MIIGSVRLYCEGLAMTLDRRDDIAVIATATGDADVVERVRAISPAVLIVDVQSSGMVDVVLAIRRECPSVRIVALAINEGSDSLIRCAEAGVSGYVTRDAGIDDLVTMIESVVRDQFVCPPQIVATLLRRLATYGENGRPQVAEDSLTSRERQVLAMICEGLSNKEIADACNISEATVKNHVHHVLEKKKARTRWQLAALGSGSGTTRRR
jgi:two-component system nitrate/nitrite response regulator NarL